jgi:hypothetical protein
MKRSRGAPDASPNAFAVLMESGKKKKKTRQSQYVQCPAGCGKHVPEFDINGHLDVCMNRKHLPSLENTVPSTTSDVNETPARSEKSLSTDTKPATMTSLNHTKMDVHVSKREENVQTLDKKSEIQTEDTQNDATNVFSHMMKRSAKVFASSEASKLAQRFHLNADGSVSLTCYSTYPGLSQPESIEWSATTQMKVRSSEPVDEIPERPTTIELVVSSAIPSVPSKAPRLVKKHSRLSIPVLKSILQKSIRRRKPLPSVRVAMELADKSIGELLRRLPIIVLEDSTLHPAFPLLTWLMVADSKGYEMPPSLMVKVFATIYEMCGCRWQDHLERRVEESSDGDATPPEVTLSSYHKEGPDHAATIDETIVWSILLRAQYGGMKGDMRMLRRYANVWKERFSSGNVPEATAQRLSPSSTSNTVTWSEIPTLIHQSAIQQSSSSSVGTLCRQGTPRLTVADISMEGVDFHCSSVLDSILNDQELVETCHERLASVAGKPGMDPMPDAKEGRRSWLEGVLKSCMWNYSAGINRRLPLMISIIREAIQPKPDQDELSAFWKELILPRAKTFAERYVKDRL